MEAEDQDMTPLTLQDPTGTDPPSSDEVENLRNSLREALHDDSIRPKMHCLLMDSSFSMVAMQGEDSAISWETTPSRCSTPWTSDPGAPPPLAPPAGSNPAGRIIVVMDEDVMSRRRKPREKLRKRRVEREEAADSSESELGRPELVEVSQPNLRGGAETEDGGLPAEDDEALLFSLVSEGSEILNIVVPPRLATVDEEQSRQLEDNLEYLEEQIAIQTPIQTAIETDVWPAPTVSEADQQAVPPPSDPPGAPRARPPLRALPGNPDYFEAFSLVDTPAPGGPAEPEAALDPQTTEESTGAQRPPTEEPAGPSTDQSDAVSLLEITSELLDEVFYAGTDQSRGPDSGGGATRTLARLPSKPSGASLFDSEEQILTPVYLPEGPPRIIDPALLEEPKALAFLYTDLYEAAQGSRRHDDDNDSLGSEKSFHSRHSDPEARGYLEKYVLIDETPNLEAEPKGDPMSEPLANPPDGARILNQSLFDLQDFVVTTATDMEPPNSEEEITDFFRSSGNSSPCDMEPFPRSREEEEAPKPPKRKPKTEKSVSIRISDVPDEPISNSSSLLPYEENDWEFPDNQPEDRGGAALPPPPPQQDSDSKPVAPPRRRAASSLKASLDLTPLTPVDAPPPPEKGGGAKEQQEEVGGAKEQQEEEKESASPVETADEGEGDTEETTTQTPPDIPAGHDKSAGSVESEALLESFELISREPEREEGGGEGRGEGEGGGGEGRGGEDGTETAQKQAEEGDVVLEAAEPTENKVDSLADEAKIKGQCIIL